MTKEQIIFLKKVIIIFLILLVLLGTYIYSGQKNKIVIATKNLTEQRIVAYMLQEVIQRDMGVKVDVKTGMDATSFIHGAILHGDVDMYIEYSSTSFLEIFGQNYTGQDNEYILEYIKKEYQNQYNLEWVTTLGFDNSNALICMDFCIENDIKTYSDIAKYNFSFAAPPYFYTRSDGYNLLEDNYDFLENVDKKKMDLSIIYVALLNGSVDLGLAFTTDAKLSAQDYIILEDDLNVFPTYDAGIVVREDTLKNYGELESILDKFEGIFTNEVIQEANNKVENEGVSAKKVAHELVEDYKL